MKIHELYKVSPEAALEATFQQEKERLSCIYNGKIFIWVSSMSEEGIRYGKFTHVSKDNIKGRDYSIEFFDGEISILMNDVWYIPKTYSWIHKDTKKSYNSIFSMDIKNANLS